MRKAGIILLTFTLIAIAAHAQKGKTAHQGQVPDSLSADSLRIAAKRGGALMAASRDSIRFANARMGSSVVDTFAMATEHNRAYSKLKESDIKAARRRIAESEKDIDFAFGELALSKSKGMYSNKEIVAASAKIQAQKDRLKQAGIWLDAIEAAWKMQYAEPISTLADPNPVQKETETAVSKTGGKSGHSGSK